jgi:hypothetical protein
VLELLLVKNIFKTIVRRQQEMSKYLVYAPVGYVIGHLRYGHFEAEIEIPDDKLNDEAWILEMVREAGELIIDDFEVDGYGDIELGEVKKIDD